MSSALYTEFGQQTAEKVASTIVVDATYSPIEAAGLAVEQVAKELLLPKPGQTKKRLGRTALAQKSDISESPIPTYEDGRWWDIAACRGADPAIFENTKSPNSVELALKFCGRCAVQTQCLNDDLSHDIDETFGTRGGKTQAERRAMKRRLKNK